MCDKRSGLRDRDRERNRNRNAIRGPQSALTDFLGANNISARQIRLDHERRRREAEQNAPSPAAEQGREGSSETEAESSAQATKKKRKQDAAIQKIKESKKFRKMKKDLHGEPGEDDDEDIAMHLYEKAKPVPGQLDNCEECGKRFTVTPYSKEGPLGGLLCTKCSKAQEAEKKKIAQNKKSRAARENRRKLQSEILDGGRPQGLKPLSELCIETVAENIHDVDEFGDMPPKLLDRLSQILSKRRLLTSDTLGLFLGPDVNRVAIYDCGRLNPHDFVRILQMSPNVKSLTLEHAGQIKDEFIDYLMEKNIHVESLRLEAANLVTDEKWREFFDKKGHQLRELKLTWLDYAMDDKTVSHLVDGCPNLQYLKLKKCYRITPASILKLAELRNLEHLHLRFDGIIHVSALCDLIAAVGPRLQSLSLDAFTMSDRSTDQTNQDKDQNHTLDNTADPKDPAKDEDTPMEDAADNLLAAIHGHCHRLTKLRITHNDQFSDEGIAALFHGWTNPALTYLNFSSVRNFQEQLDESDGEDVENNSTQYGVGPAAVTAMIKHSGSRLERLVLASCRHIGHAALSEIFIGSDVDAVNVSASRSTNGRHRGGLNGGRFPHLTNVDLSFVGGVDTPIVAGLFRAAPRVERVEVFGCFGVKDIVVPPGVALIGMPNAQEQIIMEG